MTTQAATSTSFSSFFDSLQAPGLTDISMPRFSKALNIPLGELAAAAGVHRNTLSSHPESPRAQRFARDLLRVIAAAYELCGDVPQATFFVKNKPIDTFGYKTALSLVEEGRTDDVVHYLESFASGYAG